MTTDLTQMPDRVSEIQQAVRVAGGERRPSVPSVNRPTQPKIMIIDDDMLTIEVVWNI
jgi:hypothetical protein